MELAQRQPWARGAAPAQSPAGAHGTDWQDSLTCQQDHASRGCWASAAPGALTLHVLPHPCSHRAQGSAPGRAGTPRPSQQRLQHLQSHFPHCLQPWISTSVYLNWLVIAELICLNAEPETLGSWTGKSQTNKQNLLKLWALLNSSALSTKHLREIISSVRVMRPELFHSQMQPVGFGGLFCGHSAGLAPSATEPRHLPQGQGTSWGSQAEAQSISSSAVIARKEN